MNTAERFKVRLETECGWYGIELQMLKVCDQKVVTYDANKPFIDELYIFKDGSKLRIENQKALVVKDLPLPTQMELAANNEGKNSCQA
jgi:hypothetical protein